MSYLIRAPLMVCLALSTITAWADPVDDSKFNNLRTVKHFMYGTMTFQSAVNILTGKAQPLSNFDVLADPPSIFINYEIPETNLEALAEYLNLPEGFLIEKIAILEGEQERYYLSLNIYDVSGLNGQVSGSREEWSVYVSFNGSRKSFMVVEAQASVFSLDPVDLFTTETTVTHGRGNLGIQSLVDAKGTQFSSTISSEGIEQAELMYGA